MFSQADKAINKILQDIKLGKDDLSHFMENNGKRILTGVEIEKQIEGRTFQLAFLSNILFPILHLYDEGKSLKKTLILCLKKQVNNYTGLGWRYFPTIDAMPEDFDTTSEMLRASLYYELIPIDQISKFIKRLVPFIRTDGKVPTWIIKKSQEREIALLWHGLHDLAVAANVGFLFNELSFISHKFQIAAKNISRKVYAQYLKDKRWRSYWYHPQFYVNFRCFNLLINFSSKEDKNNLANQMLQNIYSFIGKSKNPNGLNWAFAALIIELIKKNNISSWKIENINTLKQKILKYLNDQILNFDDLNSFIFYSNPSPINANIKRKWSSATLNLGIFARALHSLYC